MLALHSNYKLLCVLVKRDSHQSFNNIPSRGKSVLIDTNFSICCCFTPSIRIYILQVSVYLFYMVYSHFYRLVRNSVIAPKLACSVEFSACSQYLWCGLGAMTMFNSKGFLACSPWYINNNSSGKTILGKMFSFSILLEKLLRTI